MKCLISLILTALLATAALSDIHKPYKPIRLSPGQTYVYEYRGRLLTGIPQLADQYAGFEIIADLFLQPLNQEIIAMKLDNIKVGKHNGRVPNSYQEEIVMNHQPDPQYQRELTKSIRFVYRDGKIQSFEADVTEPQWSLNIKKSILSLFNINLTPKKIIKSPKTNINAIPRPENDLTVYPIYEEGIGGICETVYEINSIPDHYSHEQDYAYVLNVTKTRNYDNCLTEPVIVNDNYDVRGCPWVCRKEKSFPAVPGYYPTPDAVTDPYMSGCPCGKEPHESPVDSFNFVNYNISLHHATPLIEQIYSEGKVTYKKYGDELIVIVQQNITLAKAGKYQYQIRPIPQPQRHNELAFRLPKPQLPPGPKMPLDIPYYHLFGEPNVPELTNLVPELLDSFASEIVAGDVSTSKNSMQKSVQIVNALAVLPESALLALYEDIAKPGKSIRATPKEQVIRKLYLDSLPLSGSNQAALFITKLILNGYVTVFEAKELVEAVPQNLFLPDVETIDAYLELFQDQKIQNLRHLAASTGIAFGKMVKEAWVKRQYTPGDIPDENTVPHNKRNLNAQLVVQPSDPQNPSRVTIQQVLPSRVTVAHSGLSSRIKRSAPWEDAFVQQVVKDTDIHRYVQIVARLLDQANTFHQKVTLIETLAHMGVPHVLEILEPYISGSISPLKCPGYVVEKVKHQDEECDFLRQIVIYALSHVTEHYPKQVLPLVLPVYNDPSEPYQVRIAAFTTLLWADPEKQVLEKIASELYTENNHQIQSFVYSSLKTIGNFSLPCFEKLARNAGVAYDHAPQFSDEYGMQYSKMVGYDYYDEKRDFGIYGLGEWVSNNVSRVPRSGYFSFSQSNGPFQDDFVQFGYNSKGVEPFLERILEPNGLISDMFEGMHAKKDRRITKRNADSAQQAMLALKEKLDFEYRSAEEPKATIFFKLFDRTSYFALDKHYIHQLIDDAEDYLKDIAQSLLTGANYHYVKLLMPSQLYKVVPSEMGLPIVISHRHPTILSLKVTNAKLNFEASPKTIYPTGVNITAMFEPSLYYSSYTFAFAINPADRQSYGSYVEKTTQLQFPVEVSLGYVRPKNLFTWSVIPKLPHEVHYHKTVSKTFIAKAQIAGSPDQDWLHNAEEIQTMPVPFKYDQIYGNEMFGLGIRSQVTAEDPWIEKYANPYHFAQNVYNEGFAKAIVEYFRNPGLKPREWHIILEPDHEVPAYGFDFSLKYKWITDSEEGADPDDSDESSAGSESDSDESDESSASKSSESNSSESKSKNSKSSKSSKSSEESDESNKTSFKHKIKSRLVKVIKNNSKISKELQQHLKGKLESHESSDESSNESGDQSWSTSQGKQSSQSSSSESDSSEQKHKHKRHNSKSKSQSAYSSESSSSSSESDESKSFEDLVFDYVDVMKLIYGNEFKKHSIRKIAHQLIKKTKSEWGWAWNEDENEDKDDVPATIAHDFVFTALVRGPRPSYYAANVLYVHTYDFRTIWVKADGHVKTPIGYFLLYPKLFCADAVVSYPSIPGEFYYDPTAMQTQQAKFQAHAGWGQQCHHQGGVIVSGVMEKTEDKVITYDDLAVQHGSSPYHVKDWYYHQCQIDRSEGQPLSHACQQSIIQDSYFNQFIIDFQYKHIPLQIQNYTSKFDLFLKTLLYNNLYEHNPFANNTDHHLRVISQYSARVPGIPLWNLRIQTPNETTQYEKIYTPHIRPISSLVPTAKVYSNLLFGYDYHDTCAVMEDFVRTFDNVTYQLPDNQCQYLVAKDCSPKEKFAIYSSQLDPEAKTKAVTVYIEGHQIKMLPPTQYNLLQVVVDGHTHELTFKKPITLKGNYYDIRVYLRKTVSGAVNPIAVLESDYENVKVYYDGKNVKVYVGDRYRGKTCGLCGDNNYESYEEFEGPNRCVYEDAYDFANSYALSGLHCESTPIPQGYKRCPIKYHEENEGSVTVIKQKQVKVMGQYGTTTYVQQQVQQQPSQVARQYILQNQSATEELVRKQQQQYEHQSARQGGEPLTPVQESALYGANPQQQKILQQLQTRYIERDDMVCFTTKPVLTCVGGRPTTSKQMLLDFHCLPKQSSFTQQLIVESHKTVIRQLANKRVDIRQQFDVPIACVSF